jgi:hypothetical protein
MRRNGKFGSSSRQIRVYTLILPTPFPVRPGTCLLDQRRPPARLHSAPLARPRIPAPPLLVGEVWMNSGLRAMRCGRVSRRSLSPRASQMKMVRPPKSAIGQNLFASEWFIMIFPEHF